MKTLKSWKLGSSLAGAILLGALATLPARAQNYPSQILAQSPVHYWRFNETTNSAAPDTIANLGSAGAAATGYASGGAMTGQPGIVGTCVLLTNEAAGLVQYVGNCYSRIDIPTLPELNPQPPFTIEFWANPRAGTDGFFPNDNPGADTTGLCAISSLSAFPNYSSRSGYLFYAKPNGWNFEVGGEESYSASAPASVSVTASNWMHVVGEFDGVTASIYINGVLQGTGAASPSAPFDPNHWVATRIGGSSLLGDEYIFLGAYGFYYDGNRGWDGLIDEFAVYNTLLSSNTIMSHYTTATTTPSAYDALVLDSHPVGYWNMDDPAYSNPGPGTFAADLGSLGDNGTNTFGTLANQPGVPGLNGGSVFYNGTLGSLAIDTNTVEPSFDGSGQQMTLAAWIKPNAIGFMGDIIVQGFDNNVAENFLIAGDSFDWEDYFAGGNYNTNILPDVAYYEIGTWSDLVAGFNSAAFPIPPGDVGNWVFLVGTYDGANWNLYRNGSLVAQFDDGGVGPSTVSDPWSVGSRSTPNPYYGQYFDGAISEAAIFTNALDAATISNLYNLAELAPVITQAPTAPSPAYLGSSADFSVWADGTGTLSYQWSFNGGPVTGQTATNYTLTALTAAANGTYSVVVTNAYGAATSSVVLVVTPTLPPATLVPAAETRWIGSPLAFAPATLPNQELSFQWDFDGSAITGATQSSYSAPATSDSAGSYTLVISNSFGISTSTVATLAVLAAPNNYVSNVLADQPLSYLRLDESAGPIAYDYAGGNNGTYAGSLITLGVPGYSLVDTDTAASFPGVALNYVGNIGPTAINFFGPTPEFSIEAWANGGATQIESVGSATGAAVIAKGHSNNGTSANEQFAIAVNAAGLYSFFVRDDAEAIVSATAKTGPDGNWHHLVGVFDGSGKSLTLYIDGLVAGTGSSSSLNAAGLIDQQDPVTIGSESSGPNPTYDLAYKGTISQVAIYASALSQARVQAHYAAAYGPDLAPFITVQPVSATNYVTLPATLSVTAAGTQPLNYQWNQNGVPVAGATANTYTIPSLASTDAGTYTVGITNTLTGGVLAGVLSAPVTLTVLQPPTSPPAISGLVLHLTFDNTLADSSGRGNDATNEASGGATLITNDYVAGQIGEAFQYQTSVTTGAGGNTNANYASLGVRPDLQFGSDVSFTVSMWVAEQPNYTGNDLPFFCDVVGSTFGHPGFCFEPSFGTTVGTTAGWAGGWGFSVFGSTDTGVGVYGDRDLINDSSFHNLIYVIDRKAGATVYLDGVVAHQNVQSGSSAAAAGNINTTNAATIGQDPTGLYGQPGTFYIDDLGVWVKALSPLEAASIYMAGSVNQLSFTTAPTTFTLKELPGSQLQLTWNAGIIQSTTNLSGPWTDVSGATSPYVVSPTGTQQFFRGKF